MGGRFAGLTASQNLKSDLVGCNPDQWAELSPFPAAAFPSCEWISGARRNDRAFAWRLSLQRNMGVLLGNVVGVDPNSKHVLLENGAIPCAEADADPRRESAVCRWLLIDSDERSCISACAIAGSSA